MSTPPDAPIPDFVPVSEPDHLSLGQTMSQGLGQALSGFMKTAPSLVPLVLGGTTLVFIATALFMVVIFASVGGYGALLSTRPSANIALAITGGYVFVVFAASYLFIVVVAALISPFYVAMLRSHWRSIEHDVQLGVLDGIKEGFRLDLLVAATLLLSLQSIGFTLLLLPGILVDAVTNLTMPGMVIDGLGLWRALGRSVRHFFKAPIWHVGLAVIDFVMSAALNGFVPIIGYAVAVSLQIHLTLHAYLDAFPRAGTPSPDADESVDPVG